MIHLNRRTGAATTTAPVQPWHIPTAGPTTLPEGWSWAPCPTHGRELHRSIDRPSAEPQWLCGQCWHGTPATHTPGGAL